MKQKLIKLLVLFLLLNSQAFSQIFSQKDIINVYDPFTIKFDNLVLNTNDDEFKDHTFIIVVTITIGPEKIIKFFYKNDLLINGIRNFNDDYWQVNLTAIKNNVIILPALSTIINSGGLINIRMEGYSNLSTGDEMTMNQLSTGYVYTSSQMYNDMEQAYRFLATSPEINKPNTGLITTAEVLQRNISTRAGIFYLGNPTDVSYVIPKEPNKVVGTNVLVQGDKKIESKLSNKSADVWNLTITKLLDVKIMQNEAYYSKIKGAFGDISSMQKIDENKREGLIARCNEIINDDLVFGRKSGSYLNDEIIRQMTHLLNFLKAGIRAKSDTAGSTTDLMKSDEREALSYFETNLKENDFTLFNQYLYDDYINSGVYRGSLQKDVDAIRRYYQLK
jgi:hypothetical protein